jgi:threonine synthase
MTSTVPRLVGVQAEECSPIFDAFDKGLEKVSQWERPFSTLAAGVGDPLKGYSDDGTFTLDAIKRTHGTVVTLDEEEIRFSTEEMARLEGLFIEPTSSISAGAIRKLKESCFISEHDLVVSLLTGHGLKHFLPMNQKQVVISDFKEFELALL